MKADKIIKLTLLTLFINLAYAVYNTAIGFVTHSWWFITLSAYYIILSVMRFAVVLSDRSKSKEKVSSLFIMRFTGIFFIFLSVTLAGTAYLSIYNEESVKYHEILMITIALYSFTKITLAVINLVKSRKDNSPIVKTLRNISFADAIVSIFSLQRSMLVAFEGLTVSEIQLFNALTGTAVYIAVFILGINLIGGKKVNMAKSKIVKANEKIAETVVGGYKKIENAVVDGYTKIEDRFIDKYLTQDGETVEEAKERLKKDRNQ